MSSPLHNEILKQIKENGSESHSHQENDSYLSSGHVYYNVRVPLKRKLAREWIKGHKNISEKELTSLIDELYTSDSYEEKTFASLLLEYSPQLVANLSPVVFDKWLNYLNGWAEVDSLCQSIVTSRLFLSHWEDWESLLEKLNSDKNMNKQRASLVLLTKPLRESSNARLSHRAFENIDNLKGEKKIVITKAISWLLRSLVAHHKGEVEDYLRENEHNLPKIAVRETRNKLITGKK